ncbi:hypothetical protein Tco_0730640 [Tanacetum coccineum]|uniref:Ubiquitin-like protease family profile domain-containing protein n=1 Tax=Tanacetum coccineum TaxID=301880 RepID=A0ABQ4YSF1_9ASTR
MSDTELDDTIQRKVVKNFNPKTCTLLMEDGSMIKITRELIHDILGIPMGDIKVKSLKEKNLLDPVIAKWRGMVPEIVNHDNKINISQLEKYLCTLSKADWLFDIDKIHQMDWCSYVLEYLVNECTGFSTSEKFSGPLLLLVEMKEILKDNLLKGKNLMEDTDNKLDIALEINSDDEDLKNIIEKRNEIFVTLYKDLNKKVKEDNEDKDKDLEKDDYDDEETDGEDDDDDAPDGNNDENIRNGKEKKNVDKVNKEKGGSENVKDHNVEEVITEQKDDMVWDKTNVIVPFDDYHDKEYNDNVSGVTYVIDEANVAGASNALESEKIRDPSLVVHQMIEDVTKLPFISGALKEADHDVPPVDARPSFNIIKFKLNRDRDGTVHVKKIDDVPCAAEKGSVNVVEVPAQKVVNAAKDKTVEVTKKEVPKKINVKVAVKTSAKAVEVPPDKVLNPTKKKVTAMTQFKQPRPATKIIKDDYQTPKRGRKRVAQVLEEDVVLSGKRMVNPSFALVSPYFERKTMYTKPFSVAEKKIVEYIWSFNSPEGDIIFTGKGLQIECIWFFSLYPEIQLSSNIIDLWSTILNDEEKFRGKQSVTRNIYCSTGMVDLNCDALVVNRHEITLIVFGVCEKMRFELCCPSMNEDVNRHELVEAKKKIFNDVHLVFFPCIKLSEETSSHYYLICFNMMTAKIDIIDNLNNDLEDLDLRYGPYAMALNEKEGQKSQINFFRAKYLAKILLLPYNTSKEELLKEANEKWKKQQNKSNTVTNMDVKVNKNLMKMFNETLQKAYSA